MKYTLELYATETRTSKRVIEIEASSIEDAQKQLVCLPDEQFTLETSGDISLNGMAFHPGSNVEQWTYGDWDIEDVGIEDNMHILDSLSQIKDWSK